MAARRGVEGSGMPESRAHREVDASVVGIRYHPTKQRAACICGQCFSPVIFGCMFPIMRRQTVTARICVVPVESGHPIVVQSMTNTDTADVAATVQQVAELASAGSELVRVT